MYGLHTYSYVQITDYRLQITDYMHKLVSKEGVGLADKDTLTICMYLYACMYICTYNILVYLCIVYGSLPLSLPYPTTIAPPRSFFPYPVLVHSSASFLPSFVPCLPASGYVQRFLCTLGELVGRENEEKKRKKKKKKEP